MADARPESGSATPWYRQFYIWLLIAFPALSVAGGLGTLWIAVSSDDGLVVDDYYQRGLEINQTFERDRAAAAHALGAVLQFEEDRKHLRVVLSADAGFIPPPLLAVSFLHRTRSGHDRGIVIRSSSPMIYEGPAPELAAGNWHVLLEAADWRLLESLTVSR